MLKCRSFEPCSVSETRNVRGFQSAPDTKNIIFLANRLLSKKITKTGERTNGPENLYINQFINTPANDPLPRPATNDHSRSLATSVTHMPFGPVASLTWGNGVTDARTFDLDYRMTSARRL
jgi:hypothetical protein